jgi:hypothetical protein
LIRDPQHRRGRRVRVARLVTVAAAALLPAVGAALGGCAALERQQPVETEKLLAMAGFQRFPAESDNRDVIPRDIVVQHQGGKLLYIYADPGVCRCVYVGGPEAYAKYREFAVSEAIAADMSIAAPNSASTNGPAWAIWDPHWAPPNAWDGPGVVGLEGAF